ncbi:MAG: hypothetical protein M0C28_37045 [Candidatus Moduliflexus flocculans]|nr:hypothetical protein [Candidatus Moduliflexus flocculans]
MTEIHLHGECGPGERRALAYHVRERSRGAPRKGWPRCSQVHRRDARHRSIRWSRLRQAHQPALPQERGSRHHHLGHHRV